MSTLVLRVGLLTAAIATAFAEGGVQPVSTTAGGTGGTGSAATVPEGLQTGAPVGAQPGGWEPQGQ